MSELLDNLLKLISCISDCVNTRRHFALELVFEILREHLPTGQAINCILKILLPGDRITDGLCEIAKKVEIRPELIELRMAGKQGPTDAPTRSIIFIDQPTDCNKRRSSVIQRRRKGRSHNANACHVFLVFVLKRIPSLLPRHINRNEDSCDAAYCLNPGGSVFTDVYLANNGEHDHGHDEAHRDQADVQQHGRPDDPGIGFHMCIPPVLARRIRISVLVGEH